MQFGISPSFEACDSVKCGIISLFLQYTNKVSQTGLFHIVIVTGVSNKNNATKNFSRVWIELYQLTHSFNIIC